MRLRRIACGRRTGAAAAEPPASLKYLWAKAYHIPPETTTEESGYFSLCEGKNGKIYVGTAAYGRNSYLVEFDPATEKMRVVLDTHKLVGLPLEPTGYAAQSKIHTRNFVGPSGKIYVGSKQGYPTAEEKKTGKIATYRGGYVMTYDPATGKAVNLGMPMPLDDKRQPADAKEGEGVIDVVGRRGPRPDLRRSPASTSTGCSSTPSTRRRATATWARSSATSPTP